MRRRGGQTSRGFAFHGRRYRSREYAIEPDASAASYFLAAAAITGGEVTVEGFRATACRATWRSVDCLEQMGCEVRYEADSITVVGRPLRGIDVDMNAISDTVQTLAAVALFADGPTTIRNVGHIRHKETDRIGDLATELRKLGADVSTNSPTDCGSRPGALQRRRDRHLQRPSHGDELGAGRPARAGVVILDPGARRKRTRGFFADLARLAGNDASLRSLPTARVEGTAQWRVPAPL